VRIITPTSNIIGIISPVDWLNTQFIRQKFKSKEDLGNDVIKQLIEQCLDNPANKVLQRIYYYIENEQSMLDDFIKSTERYNYHPFGKVMKQRVNSIVGYLYTESIQKGCESIRLCKSIYFDEVLKQISGLLEPNNVKPVARIFRPYWNISWINNYIKYLDNNVKKHTLTILIGVDPIIVDNTRVPIDDIELIIASESSYLVKAILDLGMLFRPPFCTPIINMHHEGLDGLFMCNISVADLLIVKRYLVNQDYARGKEKNKATLGDINAILQVVGKEYYQVKYEGKCKACYGEYL